MDDFYPNLAPEIWELVFAWLSFYDQVNCRLVCKHWLNLITSLPEFKVKNCLNLDVCTLSANDPPVTTILSSELQFSSMKVKCDLDYLRFFTSLKTFFDRVGETVTCLDVSEAQDSSDIFRILVENLYMFKVLKHLNIGTLTSWLKVAYSTSPGPDVLKWIVARIFSEQFRKSPEVRAFVEHRQEIFFTRHEKLLLNILIENYVELYDEDKQLRDYSKTIEVIEKTEEAIKEADKLVDFSTRTNTSVRILSIKLFEGITDIEVERILNLVPNVNQFHIDCGNVSFTTSDNILESLKKLSDKITSLQLYQTDINRIQKLNLPNLRHFENFFRYEPFPTEMGDHVIQLFPKIESFGFGRTGLLPQAHFNCITEMRIYLKPYDQLKPKLQLNQLAKLKNLKKLSVSLLYMSEPEICFFEHQPAALNTVKYLELDADHSVRCLECVSTILQSVPKLRELDFYDSYHLNCLDKVFLHQPNLEKLCVKGCRKFEPNNEWPEMMKLRIFTVYCRNICGKKDSWDNFGKKFKKLKYFCIYANQSSIDVMQIIGSNMPALQKISFLIENSRDARGTKTKMILRNGRMLAIEEYEY